MRSSSEGTHSRPSARPSGARAALADGPEEWSVTIGHELKQPEIPIAETASRARLLPFLRGVDEILGQALEANGYVHWAGGE